MAADISGDSFDAEVLESSDLVMIDFYSAT